MTRLPYKIPQSGLKKKIQKSTFSQFWTLDVQDQDASRVHFWWDLSSDFQMCSCCVLMWLFLFLCCLFLYLLRTQALLIRATLIPSFNLNYLLKGHISNTVTLGIMASTFKFWRDTLTCIKDDIFKQNSNSNYISFGISVILTMKGILQLTCQALLSTID